MAGAKVPLTFRIFKNDQLLREETLTQAVIKVGKLSSSHLRLDDESVSRMHAVIEVSGPGEISIIDLGSTKGTVVNGQKVNKAKLQDGDLIVLGDTRIELTIGSAEAAYDADDDPTKVNAPHVSTGTGPQQVISSAPPPPPMSAPAVPTAAPTLMGLSAPAPRPAPPPMPMQPIAPPMPGMGPSQLPPPAGMAPPVAYGAPAPARYPAAPVVAPQFGLDSVEDLGGERAIEVAAMLQDTVVAVKHVMSPRGGKTSTMTWAMFGAGAALLLMGVIAFGIGVDNAALNKRRLNQWTEVDRKPIHDFRPVRISLGFDWMAFGGLIGGLLGLTVGLIRYRNEHEKPFFRIGRAAGVEFPTDDSPADSFMLVGPNQAQDDFVFQFAQGMDGEMMLDGTSLKLAELAQQGRARPSAISPGAYEVQIPHKARFRVRTGKSTFLVSSVPQPRRQTAPILATLETAVLAYFGGSALVHAGILALLFSIPPDPKSLSLDVLGNEGRLSRVQAKPPEDPKQEEQLSQDDDDGKESGGTGTKMALEEGKMGKKDSTRQSGQYAMKNNQADPQLARLQAMDNARRSGILGALRSQPGGAFASITGTGDFSSGLDDRDVYGGLIGNEVGEMQGGWGYGLQGTGPGGGGTGWGTIGTGRYGTIGHGSGTGSGYGVGSGRGGMRGRRATTPDVHIGNASTTGDLDRNIIRRYIRMKLRQITYCYEKQLLVNPGLQGTVVTQFTINGVGAVISANAGGMGSKEVEGCVADVIKTIQFPKPKGGGLVNVRYPFTFTPAGT